MNSETLLVSYNLVAYLLHTFAQNCWTIRHSFELCRTARRSSILPLNHSGSVSTEITSAPANAYTRACAGAQVLNEITPLLGEARLISAIKPKLCFVARNLSGKDICGGDRFRS